MRNELILLPFLCMMVLTALVWVFMYAKRFAAMRKVGKPAQEYRTPDRGAALLPEEVSYPAHNFRNLFEMPVLFYALCLYLYVTATAATPDIVAAWVFFGFRAAHSAIHCTTNIVKARFLTYLAATLALWFMLARAVWGVCATLLG